jgi:alpha-mannosidase
MLEEDIKPLHIHQNKIELTFRPFEIKTIRLKLADNDLPLSGNTA